MKTLQTEAAINKIFTPLGQRRFRWIGCRGFPVAISDGCRHCYSPLPCPLPSARLVEGQRSPAADGQGESSPSQPGGWGEPSSCCVGLRRHGEPSSPVEPAGPCRRVALSTQCKAKGGAVCCGKRSDAQRRCQLLAAAFQPLFERCGTSSLQGPMLGLHQYYLPAG